jgi:CRISPR-associated protein Csd1
VRYWLNSEYGALAASIKRHIADITINPSPWKGSAPAIHYLLAKATAPFEREDDIPVSVISGFTRAALEGQPYPQSLLSAVIGRLHAGASPGAGWHAALLKAYINRLGKDILPVSRTPDHPATSYQLGRLFAIICIAQNFALGRVNTTVTDRYFRAASVTPARVFGTLLFHTYSYMQTAKQRGHGLWLDARLAEIMSRLPPDLPKTLSLPDQARFAVGYYHERSWRGSMQADLGATEAMV